MTRPAHDQTRGETIPFFQDGQTAQLSSNEVYSLCMKAARGAGMSWGMAEEAGFAASWLISHGIDGPTHLALHLTRADGLDWDALCPKIRPGVWHNEQNRPLCPIILGATLCDYVGLPEGPSNGQTIDFGRVSAPVLMLPFLSEVATMTGARLTFAQNGKAMTIGDTPDWPLVLARMLEDAPQSLSLTVEHALKDSEPIRSGPNAHTTAATIAALNTFAMRTTVPATESSRAGAGSTLSDND